MARKKAVKTEATVAAPKAAAVKPKAKKFISVSAAQFHPFQRVRIPLCPPGVMLEEDSWTLCQVEAGIIKEL
jgi:hypothetical protein